jgi:RNA polymerase sigma-70 factor (ECF subfamily)
MGIVRVMEYLSDNKEETQATSSDEELLSRSLSEPALFAQLVERYEAAFLRKAGRILNDPQEAEDAVQEAFTKIYLYGNRFKKQEGASFSSWAYRILINTALTKYQKKKRERGLTAPLDPEIYELLPDGEDTAGKRELADEVASILVRMPAPLAQALSTYFLKDVPHESAANEMGLTEGAVKTRVHRAKKEFKRIYESLKPLE